MDKKRLTGLFLVAAIQIIGFALLWEKITGQHEYIYLPATSNAATGETQVNAPLIVVRSPDEKMLREIIQSVIKQELSARQLASAPDTTQQMAPPEPLSVKENSPANAQAISEAISVVDSAIAQGKWTATDSAALIQHNSDLTDPQRRKILEKIGGAINSQELKLEDLPPSL